jgi:hypothetical protein
MHIDYFKENIMKKTGLLLIFLFTFSLLSCGGGGKSAKKSTPEPKQETHQSQSLNIYESENSATPSWFENPPKASNFYYFAGVGKGKKPEAAKNAALADIFSQIVYMINASVTSNSTFEQYVEENEQEARRNSSIYKKVRAKGEAVIEQFEIEKQSRMKEQEGGENRNVFFVLAKVPKSEIEKAKERIEKDRARRRANPMGVFAVALFPDNEVEEISTIKSELEQLYRNMGFNIKSVDVNFPAGTLKSTGSIVNYLQSNAMPQISKALICVIRPSNVRRETLAGSKITSVLGDMTIREINLKTGEIVSSNTLDGKGVSMRKGEDSEEDAFRKLIKDLTEKLLTDGEGEKEDGYL